MEWKEYKLSELCTKVTDGSHFSPTAKPEGYPMFSVKDMLEYGFDYSSCKRISLEDFDKMLSSGCVPQKDDILVAKDGSYLKQIFICKETKEEAILSSIAIFRPDPQKVTPLFLCYLLKSPQVYNYIAGNCVSGSALPRIVLKAFKEVKMSIPSLSDQRKISSILSSLDSKIETNNKLNAKLEELAQTIFKSWFVDFEPFKDQKMVESELGLIPEGWKVGKLSDVAEVTSGKRPPQKAKEKDDVFCIPLIGAADVMGYTTYALYKEAIIVIGRVGTHGVVQRWKLPCWPSDNTLVIKSTNYNYTYFQLKNIDYKSINRGSTQPLITQTDIKNTSIITPKPEVLDQYENIVSKIFNIIETNEQENQRLASLRDTLLPKLMSGEIVLRQAQEPRNLGR